MIHLTRGEQRFILFLLIALFVGLGVDVLKKPAPPAVIDDAVFSRAALLPATAKTEIVSRVNINKADVEQLVTLPGIGAVTAQRIIDYRQAHGSFASIEEIQKVQRIGAKTFDKIKSYITVK